MKIGANCEKCTPTSSERRSIRFEVAACPSDMSLPAGGTVWPSLSLIGKKPPRTRFRNPLPTYRRRRGSCTDCREHLNDGNVRERVPSSSAACRGVGKDDVPRRAMVCRVRQAGPDALLKFDSLIGVDHSHLNAIVHRWLLAKERDPFGSRVGQDSVRSISRTAMAANPHDLSRPLRRVLQEIWEARECDPKTGRTPPGMQWHPAIRPCRQDQTSYRRSGDDAAGRRPRGQRARDGLA